MTDGLAERLRQVRGHLGLSSTDMAERVGLNVRKTWERYERGETRPNSDTLAALHDLGIDTNWLLSGEGLMLRLPPVPPAATQADPTAYTQDDLLYEIAIKATLRWYEAAGLAASPDGLAGMISRAVRMLRGKANVDRNDEPAMVAEVEHLLDVAHEMLRASGWKPRQG